MVGRIGLVVWFASTTGRALAPLKAWPYSTRTMGRHRRTSTAATSNLIQDWIKHDNASFHEFSDQQATEIRSALLTWYSQHRRKLPWRGDPPPYNGSTAGFGGTPVKKEKAQSKIQDFFSAKNATKTTIKQEEQKGSGVTYPVSAYGVWVSEIMLQQTRVEAVIPYWLKWMESFPTVFDLAKATDDQVNAHWAGLGFYRRARLLHQGAQKVVSDWNGILPSNVEHLRKIPGIGPYTAAAIASIAFEQPVAVVDGNVCRVLSRLCGIANHIQSPALKDKYGWKLAQQIVEAGDGRHPGEVNQAMMELGATYCAPSGTGMDPGDPLGKFYLSTRLGASLVATGCRQPLTLLPDFSIQHRRCEVCDSQGMEVALTRFQELMTTADNLDLSVDVVGAWGHAVLPLDPPKKAKREEDLAVAAFCVVWKSECWWLLTKRPSDAGLLAGQWEFPAALVQTRSTKIKHEPTKETIRKALDEYLESISPIDCNLASCFPRKRLGDTALEHLFSHIKHIMWVESSVSNSLSAQNKDSIVRLIETRRWMTTENREVKWMRSSDMEAVGITARVRKVMDAVKKSEDFSTPSKKRRRSK